MKWAFRDISSRFNDYKPIIRKYTKQNDHTEVSLNEAEFAIDYNGYISQRVNIITNLSSNREISDKELKTVLQQCLSKDEATARMGCDILFRLNSNKYLDIQNVIHNKFFNYLDTRSYSTALLLFNSISGHQIYATISSGTPPSIHFMYYMANRHIHNLDLFIKITNWVFDEYPIAIDKRVKGQINV